MEETGIATAHSTGDVMESDEAGALDNVFSTHTPPPSGWFL